jgi:hypothetical protein
MSATEQEVLNCERQYWQAMLDKDANIANHLTDYPSIMAGAQGVSTIEDGKQTSGMLNASDWSLNGFNIGDDAQVRMISDDVALLAYTVEEDLTVEGQPVKLKAADASVWVKRDGQWLCAMHTESVAGDPFGRDRQSTH